MLAVNRLLRHDRSRCTKDLRRKIGLRTGDPDVYFEISLSNCQYLWIKIF